MLKESNKTVVLNCRAQNYNGIDVMKFICAILVVLIHIPLFNAPVNQDRSHIAKSVNFWLNNTICRVAVPFYFVCSGFFLFRKMDGNTMDRDRVKSYCFKLCRIYGIWSVLLFTGGHWHLWFIGATVVAVTLLSLLLHKHVKIQWLIVIACIFYTMGLLGETYFWLIEPFINKGVAKHLYSIYTFFVSNPRNGFSVGFLFVFMGYYFAQGKPKLNPWISLGAFFVSMICLSGEIILLDIHRTRTNYNMYISLLPAVFFLFAFISAVSLKDRPVYGKLRTVGVLIYFLHILINAVFVFGADLLYRVLGIDIQPLRFFVVLLITLLSAFGIEWLSNIEKFQWLRWILA